MRDGEEVEDGVGGAAQGVYHGDGILEGLHGHDVPGPQPPPQHPEQQPHRLAAIPVQWDDADDCIASPFQQHDHDDDGDDDDDYDDEDDDDVNDEDDDDN
jgi:hypothetical protein